jgi:Domain of unknown function (DUF4326)
MITVINGKLDGFVGEDKIYIGRANKYYRQKESPLHNPFKIPEDGDRSEVSKKFDKYLYQKVKLWMNEGILDETMFAIREICFKVLDGQEVILCCYCKPLQCHGDGIVRCVEWIIKQDWFKAYSEWYE